MTLTKTSKIFKHLFANAGNASIFSVLAVKKKLHSESSLPALPSNVILAVVKSDIVESGAAVSPEE